jgi:lysyl-tRNA synthetase class I
VNDGRFWSNRSFLSLIDSNALTSPTLLFEIGPAGKLHLGHVRCLLRLRSFFLEAVDADLRPRAIIRVQDHATIRKRRNSANPAIEGIPVERIFSDNDGNVSIWRETLEDLHRVVGELAPEENWHVVSDLYDRESFWEEARRVLAKQEEILAVLRPFQTHPPMIFRPLCPFCGRSDAVNNVRVEESGEGVGFCTRDRRSFHFSLFSNGGRFSFKIETALLWGCLHPALQVYGLDHLEAFRASVMVSSIIECVPPIPAFVNFVVDHKGHPIGRTSHRGHSWSDLPISSRVAARRRLEAMSDQRPIREDALLLLDRG